MKPLTIGRLAREARVNLETVRYYERRGLLKSQRGASGYRLFPQEAARRTQVHPPRSAAWVFSSRDSRTVVAARVTGGKEYGCPKAC